MEDILSLASRLAIYLIVMVGLNNFVLGRTSIWSVGHIAFFGIGGWVTGILVRDFHLNGWIGLGGGVFFSVTASVLIGVTTLRLKSDYFILMSIVVCEIVRIAMISIEGPNGMSGIGRPTILGISLDSNASFLVLLLLPTVLLAFALAKRYESSRAEKLSRLVRAHESLAVVLRVSPLYYRLGSFAIGSGLTGLAGGLYTFLSKGTDPSAITLYQSILLFSMAIFGGVNSLLGTILGGVMVVVVPRLIENLIRIPGASFYSSNAVQLAFGALLLIVINTMPGGIAGTSSAWLQSEDDA